jgi:hypothetical protein
MELRDKGKYGFLLPPELIIPVGEYCTVYNRSRKIGD